MKNTAQINVRLPEAEFESIKEKAASANMSTNAFIRAVLKDAFVEFRVGHAKGVENERNV